MSSTLYTLPGRSPAPMSGGDRFFRWAAEHRAQLGLALAVAALAALFSVLIVVNRGKLAERGADQLTMARSQAGAGKKKEALQILDEVLRANRANPVALQAALMKGELLMADGKFNEAGDLYEETYARAASPAYRPLLLAGMASAAVEMKMYAEAVGRYETLIKDFPDHYLVPRAYMETGRLRRELNQPEIARAAFEKLATLYPRSAWAPEAQAALAELKPPTEPSPAKK